MVDPHDDKWVARALSQGDLKLQGQFVLGSNYTFLVSVHSDGKDLSAVYKPSRGEKPLWDFPDNTLAQREVAAYVVSEALGFGFVPCTVLREDVPVYGPGSIQQYIDYDPEYHYFNFSEDDKAKLPPVVLFDLLINNADRKGSHVLIEKGTGKLWAIDHGLCFHEEDKLRTVLWDSAGDVIPEELRARLESLLPLLAPGGALRTELGQYLAEGEIEIMKRRARALLQAGTFPLPPQHRRAFPYPPI